MDKITFLQILYRILNTTGRLSIVTLAEVQEENALYVELSDGSKYRIQVSPTNCFF
ncbi:MAG: hypothetical protein Q4E89_03330 [Eubacteriales bacterium]|nr:hypothetical protein [Eubacteriales bacterium]